MKAGELEAWGEEGPCDVTFAADRIEGRTAGRGRHLYLTPPAGLDRLPMLVLDGQTYAPGTSGKTLIVPVLPGEHRFELRACRSRPSGATGRRGKIDDRELTDMERTAVMMRLAVGAVLALLAPARGADWPTYLHDAARSGATAETLAVPLALEWVFQPGGPPAAGWGDVEEGAVWKVGLPFQQPVAYDDAYHVAAVGDAVYFCASGEHKVYCIDAARGAIRWTAFTAAPARCAPTVKDGRVYVGADDGCVYCLRATDGSTHLAAQRRAAGRPRRRAGPRHVAAARADRRAGRGRERLLRRGTVCQFRPEPARRCGRRRRRGVDADRLRPRRRGHVPRPPAGRRRADRRPLGPHVPHGLRPRAAAASSAASRSAARNSTAAAMPCSRATCSSTGRVA